jgi:hypothetical protein
MASKKTIDDYKGTQGHKQYYKIADKAAKERSKRTFFAISGFKK